jgi:hypothetical protein
MMNYEFQAILDKRLVRTRELLAEKSQQYSVGQLDRLCNFRRVGKMLHHPMKTVLFGYVGKHWDALLQYEQIERVTGGSVVIPIEQWIDKLEDVIAYMILLEAICHDQEKMRHGNKTAPKAPENPDVAPTGEPDLHGDIDGCQTRGYDPRRGI